MSIRRCLRSFSLALMALATFAVPSHAQMAPTGSHYGGRPTDTGFSGVSDQGGFAASVPLDLPPSRGGLPIPLQIVSGGRGVGAAGLGWDVPLSYVLVDSSIQRRRPMYQPGAATAPRERITVVLPGRSAEMVQTGTGSWIGRFAPDLSMNVANEQLLTAMEKNPDFAPVVEEMGIKLTRTPTGRAPRESPDGWTWHHEQEPGLLRLVPSVQHWSKEFWRLLHPGNRGGFSIWGGEE